MGDKFKGCPETFLEAPLTPFIVAISARQKKRSRPWIMRRERKAFPDLDAVMKPATSRLAAEQEKAIHFLPPMPPAYLHGVLKPFARSHQLYNDDYAASRGSPPSQWRFCLSLMIPLGY